MAFNVCVGVCVLYDDPVTEKRNENGFIWVGGTSKGTESMSGDAQKTMRRSGDTLVCVAWAGEEDK